jgi:hypothetical protein
VKALYTEGGAKAELVKCINQVEGKGTRSRLQCSIVPSISSDCLLDTVASRGWRIGNSTAIQQQQYVTLGIF